MNSIFYSANLNAFYDSEIHGENIPEDAIEISKETHQFLLEAQCEGKVITSDVKGLPIVIDAPELSKEELIAQSNADIIREIEALERDKQPRAMREFLIDGDKTRLEELNAEINTLRSKLQ